MCEARANVSPRLQGSGAARLWLVCVLISQASRRAARYFRPFAPCSEMVGERKAVLHLARTFLLLIHSPRRLVSPVGRIASYFPAVLFMLHAVYHPSVSGPSHKASTLPASETSCPSPTSPHPSTSHLLPLDRDNDLIYFKTAEPICLKL
jgi:hypothetical protein